MSHDVMLPGRERPDAQQPRTLLSHREQPFGINHPVYLAYSPHLLACPADCAKAPLHAVLPLMHDQGYDARPVGL